MTLTTGGSFVIKLITCTRHLGQDGSVGIATCCGLDGPVIECCGGGRRFPAPLQTGPGAHPASYTMDTGSFPGVKWPGLGVNHPTHLAPRLKNE